jgi:predicted dehydrogenase
LFTERDQQVWHFPVDTIPQSFIAAQKHFVECLRTGQTPETSGADTLRTMELVFAAYQSAEEERTIALGEKGRSQSGGRDTKNH